MFDDLFDDTFRHTHRNSYSTDLTSAKLDSLDAKSKARDASTEVTYLKLKVEKLMIITEAMWMILKETTKYTDEELKEKMRQIDLKDGKLDGRVAAELPGKCTKCGQLLQKNKYVCIYCGTENDTPDVFKR